MKKLISFFYMGMILFISCFDNVKDIEIPVIEYTYFDINRNQTEATIMFGTNIDTSNTITVNNKSYYSNGTDHVVDVRNLIPGTEYSIEVQSKRPDGSTVAISPVAYDTVFTTSDATSIDIQDLTVINISTNSITLTWRTDTNTSGIVEYGLNNELGMEVESNSIDTFYHSVTIYGLEPDTNYYFRLKSTPLLQYGWEETFSEVQEIRTLPLQNIGIYQIQIMTNKITTSSSIITFSTDVISSSRLEYSKNEDLSESQIIDAVTSDNLNFTAILSDLEEYTKYYIKIIASTDEPGFQNENESTIRYFTTKEKQPVQINMIKYSSASNASTIMCETNVPAYIKFHIGNTSGVYSQEHISLTSDNIKHYKTIEGLNPDKTYYYYIEAVPILEDYKINTTPELTFQTINTTGIEIIPYTPDPTCTTVEISFTTNKEVQGKVYFSETPGEYSEDCMVGAARTTGTDEYGNEITIHTAMLTGLRYSTTWYYKISTGLPADPDFTATSINDLSFRTLDRTPVKIESFNTDIIYREGIQFYAKLNTPSQVKCAIYKLCHFGKGGCYYQLAPEETEYYSADYIVPNYKEETTFAEAFYTHIYGAGTFSIYTRLILGVSDDIWTTYAKFISNDTIVSLSVAAFEHIIFDAMSIVYTDETKETWCNYYFIPEDVENFEPTIVVKPFHSEIGLIPK